MPGEDPRAASDSLRDIFDVLDGEAYLPADVLALTAWVAEYYACGPGEVVAAAVPSMVWLGSRRVVAVTDDGIRAAAGEAALPLGALARLVLDTTAAARSLPESTLRSRLDKLAGERPGRAPRSPTCCARWNGRASWPSPRCSKARLSRTRPSAWWN